MRIALFILAIVSGLVFGSTLTSKHLKRSYTYQCANLSGTDLYVTLPSGEKYYAGKIGHCGCASAAWVENAVSNSVDDAIDSAADNAGLDETTQEVENLVTSASDVQTCEYPDHATDACTSSNVCNFVCGDGYSKSDGQCVCNSPKVECNGKCQSQACSTSGMKRRQAKPVGTCPEGLAACGVRGSRIARDSFECVDTLFDVESCGGCRVPMPRTFRTPRDIGPARGHDCSMIEGSKRTTCNYGKCEVLKCLPGWIKEGKDTCVKIRQFSPNNRLSGLSSPQAFTGPWFPAL